MLLDISTGKLSVVVNGYETVEARVVKRSETIESEVSTLFDRRKARRPDEQVIQEIPIDVPDFTHFELDRSALGVPITQDLDLITMDEVTISSGAGEGEGAALRPTKEKSEKAPDTKVPIRRKKEKKPPSKRPSPRFSEVSDVPEEYAETVDAVHDMLPEKYQIMIDNLGYDAKNVLKQLKRLTGKDYSLYTAVGVPILKNLSRERAEKIKNIWENWGAKVIIKPDHRSR
ncbi:MAG: hypothetical protein J7M18_04105 [Candidatus Eremiobacteraeota bacterium]|nr:hypothetical protein [Candidatus Eremiobacteraeota bacterium]